MYGRRNPDATQKKQAAATSAAMADVLLNHLSRRPTGNSQVFYTFYLFHRLQQAQVSCHTATLLSCWV